MKLDPFDVSYAYNLNYYLEFLTWRWTTSYHVIAKMVDQICFEHGMSPILCVTPPSATYMRQWIGSALV